MRMIEQLNGAGKKGVFMINLEYKRKSFNKSVERNYKQALQEMQAKALDKVESAISFDDLNSINVYFDPDRIKVAMKSTYKEVGKYFANETFTNIAGIKKDISDQRQQVWETQMAAYVEKIGAERIKIITNTTEEEFKKIVKNVVVEAQKEGLSVQDAAKLIRQKIGITNSYRALRIARTEIVSASNQGSLLGAKSTNLNLNKVWISRKIKGRTRHSHFDVDGQIVGIDQPFIVPIYKGKEKTNEVDRMQHPGDPNGSAGNVIQCGCTQGYKRII